MKLAIKISRVYLYVIAAFFVLMSFDVFDIEDLTLLEKIGGFLISTTPGIGLALFVYLLRKREMILGFVIIGLSIFFVYFFKFYQSIEDNWQMLLLMILPMISVGILFIVNDRLKHKSIE